MDSVALGIGWGVLSLLLVGLILALSIAAYIFACRLILFIDERKRVISYRINKRYKIAEKLKRGARQVDIELWQLLDESTDLDALIYAYLNDKEAYERLKSDREYKKDLLNIKVGD